ASVRCSMAATGRWPRFLSLRTNSLRRSRASTASASGGTGDNSLTMVLSLRIRYPGRAKKRLRARRASATDVLDTEQHRGETSTPPPRAASTENRTFALARRRPARLGWPQAGTTKIPPQAMAPHLSRGERWGFFRGPRRWFGMMKVEAVV